MYHRSCTGLVEFRETCGEICEKIRKSLLRRPRDAWGENDKNGCAALRDAGIVVSVCALRVHSFYVKGTIGKRRFIECILESMEA